MAVVRTLRPVHPPSIKAPAPPPPLPPPSQPLPPRPSRLSIVARQVHKKRCLVTLFRCIHIGNDIDSLFHRPIPEPYRWIFDRRNSICLVGNGPIEQACGPRIDSHDVVVRFNTKLIDAARTGTKTTVLCTFTTNFFSNDPRVLNIMMSTNHIELNYDEDMLDRRKNVITPHRSIMTQLYRLGDPTRGFIAILLFSRYFDRISLVGFGGPPKHRENASERVIQLTVQHLLYAEHLVIRNDIADQLVQIDYLDSIRP